MTRTTGFAFAVLVATLACERRTPEQNYVENLAAALGGRERLTALLVVAFEAEGRQGNLGQDMTPDATSQGFTVSAYKKVFDLSASRMRVEQTRAPMFPYFQGQASQTQVFGIDGDLAYNVAASGTATRADNVVTADRRAEFLHHPLTAARAAMSAGRVSNLRVEGNASLADLTTEDGRSVTLAVDSATEKLLRVTSTSYNTNLGDVSVETTFDDYRDVNGFSLPHHLTTTTDGKLTTELRISQYQIGGDVGDLAAPAAAASAPVVAGPPPPTVTAEVIGKGLWLLAGQSHHSVLVEFADHLTLVEAPQHEVRTLAVIAKARELVPGKPLRRLVASHHHFDHSGGIRAAVSEGLAIVTQAAAADYYRQAAARPHTIVPDVLGRSPKPVTVETVGDELTLSDASMTVHLYHIAGNPHADTLLMAYFPQERLLVEADVFTPGAAVHPYAVNLLENIERRKLRVDRIVPLHGKPAPFSELVNALSLQRSD